MEFLIYLLTEDGEIYYKTMEPEDTIDYKFVLSDKIKIEKDLAKEYDEERIKKINKSQAIVCHTKLMKLRLNIKQYDVPGAKLIKQEKYYEDVLSAYVNFFQGQNFQLPQWRLDAKNNIPGFALNLISGENIRLSPKQGKFVRLFYEHFIHSKVGSEWMYWGEAIELMQETERINPVWKSMTNIFEKKEGKEKLNKLFDSNPEGRVIYYRLKVED